MYFYRHGEIPVYNLFTGQVQPHALQSCEGKAQDVRIWNREENKEWVVVKMASLRQKGNLVCEITAQECGKNLQLTKAISIFIKHRLKHFYKEEKQCSQACHLYVTFQSRTEIFCWAAHLSKKCFMKEMLTALYLWHHVCEPWNRGVGNSPTQRYLCKPWVSSV